LDPEQVTEKRLWCGACGTYVYLGDQFPCSKGVNFDKWKPEECAVMGRSDFETVQARQAAAQKEDVFAYNGDPTTNSVGSHTHPTQYVAKDHWREESYQRLRADAEARAKGLNLDGSPRREGVYELPRTSDARVFSDGTFIPGVEAAVFGGTDYVSPRDAQVGGAHYKKLKIQPFEYTLENGLGGVEHTIIKYVTRWKDKGGVQDLEKAKHAVEFLIAWANEKSRRGEKL
jgi:hypothetical protein